ncbi:MAG TPA: DNA-binding protein [Arcobacter sp.]|nr:DNA-binding protein [Arcobacter sp.]
MIDKRIRLGKINTLEIIRDTDFGFFLEPSSSREEIMDRSETEEYEVLLPNAYISDEMEVGDEIEVFIYRDSEDRIIATTQYPIALLDEFAFVEVVSTTTFGAFVDIGLQKDLLVPRNKQKEQFKVGDKRIIRIVEDIETNRLMGVEKITSFLNNKTKYLKVNDEVKVMVIAFTPMGYKVVVDNMHEGMIFKNECFTKLFVGNVKKAYIKNVRTDGKLDISLQPIGKEKNKDASCQSIIDLLKEYNNFLPFNSKSDAGEITKRFGMSKKIFKASLVTLQADDIITSNDRGIELK